MAVNKYYRGDDPLLNALKESMTSEYPANMSRDKVTPENMQDYLIDGADIITEDEGDTRSPFSDPEKEYIMRALEEELNKRKAMGFDSGPIEDLPPLPQKIIPAQDINDVTQEINDTNRQFLDQTLNTGIKSAPLTGGKRTKEEPESPSTLGPGYKKYQKQKQEKRKNKKEKK